MKIVGIGTETYLYLNGLKVNHALKLSENVELLPANSNPKPKDIIKVSKSEVDIGVATIFLRKVTSQLRITANDPKTLAILAWNSIWDAVLLSAVFDCNVACNFQCDKPVEDFSSDSTMSVTNYHMTGLTSEPYELTLDDALWIEKNYDKSKRLMDINKFQDAVHSMESYRLHFLPRSQLAIIWSGIEGMFGIQTEIVFRLSLYIATFLEPKNKLKRR